MNDNEATPQIVFDKATGNWLYIRRKNAVRRLPPNELGEPQRKFADTFHAVSLFEARYFSPR